MTTTLTTSPTIHHPRRRTLLSVAVVGALALGAGAAVGRVTSSDSSTGVAPKAAIAAKTNVDAAAMWDQLATMSPSQRDNVVAGLNPSVRARLHAIGEELAVAAEHHGPY